MKLNKERFLKVLQSFEDNTNDFLNISEVAKDLTEGNVTEKASSIQKLIIRKIESLKKIIETRGSSQKGTQNNIDNLDKESTQLPKLYNENSEKIKALKIDIQEKTKKIQPNINESKKNEITPDISQSSTSPSNIKQKIKSLEDEIESKNKLKNSVKVFLPVWKFFNFLLLGALKSPIQARKKIIEEASKNVMDLNSEKDIFRNLETALSQPASSNTNYEKELIGLLNKQDKIEDFDKKNKILDLEIKKMEQEIKELEDSNIKINKKLAVNASTKVIYQKISSNRGEDIKASEEKIAKLEDLRKGIAPFLKPSIKKVPEGSKMPGDLPKTPSPG